MPLCDLRAMKERRRRREARFSRSTDQQHSSRESSVGRGAHREHRFGFWNENRLEIPTVSRRTPCCSPRGGRKQRCAHDGGDRARTLGASKGFVRAPGPMRERTLSCSLPNASECLGGRIACAARGPGRIGPQLWEENERPPPRRPARRIARRGWVWNEPVLSLCAGLAFRR